MPPGAEAGAFVGTFARSVVGTAIGGVGGVVRDITPLGTLPTSRMDAVTTSAKVCDSPQSAVC